MPPLHQLNDADPLAILGAQDGWKLIQALWAHFPENMFVIGMRDDGFVIEAINPAQHAMLELPLEQCLNRPLECLFPEETAAQLSANYRRCIEAGEPLRYEERGVYLGADGCQREGNWLTLLVPVRSDDGAIRRLFGVSQNVTDIYRARQALEEQNQRLEQRVAERTRELEELNRQLEELASRDGLTNTLNRRVLYRIAGEEFQRARRYDTPLSALMLDVDEFKTFNEVHGHHYGDAVLLDVVRTLEGALRESDRLGRVGGDEFVVLLPGVHLHEALQTAERLRALIHDRSHCSISLGAASLEPGDTTIEVLFKRADDALRASKRQGRNRATPAAQGVGQAQSL
ncbi:diguanylate cyclase [Aquisalimonas sp. 2447]|uniref:sensor domain-containing diguanylate cyclase n=1 Tax=Aquisalimonas sp. 2447 TaxID=2740807 RepID=UPI00143272B9|nr:GGDEF domain-containing protein [Aquisalimonas sp. 2447]QIT56733.1 diguanylate cyclase [Aquisalimonas sp. 2447]